MVPASTPSSPRWASRRDGSAWREHHDVGAHRVGVEPGVGPALGHRLGQAAGPAWSSARRSTIALQGHEAGGGDHAGLAHAAAQALALGAGGGDDVGRAGQQRAHRRAQALREAAHHRGDRAAYAAAGTPVATSAWKRRAPSMCTGTPAAASTTASSRSERPGRAVGRHVGVLDADQADARVVVAGRLHGPGHVGRVEGAVGVGDRVELHAGVAAAGAVLVDDDVLAGAGDDRRSPGGASSRRASWLPIVPDGTKSAASLPTRSANASCRALTVGSSP